MKKLLFLLLLLPFLSIGQVSNGTETEFEALKTTNSQTITNPVYLVTEGMDGTHGKTTATGFLSSNMPITTSSTTGVINKGGERYFHDFKSPTGSAQGENVFMGRIAGNFTMVAGGVDGTSNASFNTGIGAMSLTSLTSGWSNVGTGYQSLFTLTSGKYNTATGVHALGRATTSDRNSAFGHYAGYENTTGTENSIFGASALRGNFTGSYNCYYGTESGYIAVNPSYNSAYGYRSLYRSSGGYNTAIGMNSLLNNTTAQEGVAIGFGALSNVTTGNKNVAIGSNTGAATTTGENNVFIGNEAGYRETGSQRLYIDNQSRSTDEATARKTAMVYGVFNSSVSSQFLDFNVNRLNINSGVFNENARISSTGVGFSRPSDNSVTTYFSKGLDLGSEGTARLWGYDGIMFKTQGTETVKAIITATGKMLIGTESDNGIDHLQVNGSITANGLKSTGIIRLKNYTVSTLPSGTQGDTAYVTDALAPTFMGIIAGGGSVVTKVFYNGTNWTAQ